MKHSQRGFTLVEVMIVVAIVGVLSAVCIPQYQKILERSKRSEIFAVMNFIRVGEIQYFSTANVYLPSTNVWAVGPWAQAINAKLGLDIGALSRFGYELRYAGAQDGSEFLVAANKDLDHDATLDWVVMHSGYSDVQLWTWWQGFTPPTFVPTLYVDDLRE